jgi:superfamily II DNA/RNA helicase
MVLDEADEILNMGFIKDVEEILGSVDPGRRMLLFSATMPERIRRIAEKYIGRLRPCNREEGAARNGAHRADLLRGSGEG